MDVPTHDTIGLAVYRELCIRERRTGAKWEQSYGPVAMEKPLKERIDAERFANLGTYDKAISAPMPLSQQLKQLRRDAQAQQSHTDRVEAATYPHKSRMPVSEASVGIYGASAWHTQAKGAPAKAAARPQTAPPGHARRRWSLDRTSWEFAEVAEPNRPPLRADHQLARPWHKMYYMGMPICGARTPGYQRVDAESATHTVRPPDSGLAGRARARRAPEREVRSQTAPSAGVTSQHLHGLFSTIVLSNAPVVDHLGLLASEGPRGTATRRAGLPVGRSVRVSK